MPGRARTILILEPNGRMVSDIQSRYFLEDLDDEVLKIDYAKDEDSAFALSDRNDYDEVVVSGSEVDKIGADAFGVPVTSYARNAEDVLASQDKGIPSYGIVSSAGTLLDALLKGNTIRIKDTAPAPGKTRDGGGAAQPGPGSRREWDDIDEVEPAPSGRREDEKRHGKAGGYDGRDAYARGRDSRDHLSSPPRGYTDSQNGRRRDTSYGDGVEPYDDAPAERGQGGNMRDRIREEKLRAEEEARRRAAMSRDEFSVEQDMGNIRPKARVVTIYSAKGGVGKTTIACELATFLALSAHGRGRLNVCLVDFNIDFGDVLNTLSLDPNGPCMTGWAAEIRERLAAFPGSHNNGYSDRELASLRFTETEINEWLQEVPESGLFVLPAPVTNEDSMEMSEDGEEVKVILNNLINNAGFDYIICDTGNNTRNSSFIPLEMADDIIMVMTQSVNTANCNSGFISTAHTVGFDTSRIKIVINKARPAKAVGVPTDELQEVMIDPKTKRPFECISIIKDSNDVRVAENIGKPVVYDAGNDFTKSIAGIARVVNKETFVLEKPEKSRGIFGRRKRKKDRR